MMSLISVESSSKSLPVPSLVSPSSTSTTISISSSSSNPEYRIRSFEPPIVEEWHNGKLRKIHRLAKRVLERFNTLTTEQLVDCTSRSLSVWIGHDNWQPSDEFIYIYRTFTHSYRTARVF